MPSLSVPAIRGIVQVAHYPVTMIISFDTYIGEMMNYKEQRWRRRPPLFTFHLPIGRMLASDKTIYDTFFDTASGRFADNISLQLGSTTYHNLSLMSDEIAYTLNQPIELDTVIQLRQWQNPGFAKPKAAPLAGFPLFPEAVPGAGQSYAAAKPFTQKRRWGNSVIEQASGPRYVWKWIGAGLTGFPIKPLYAWDVPLNNISDAMLQVLIDAIVGWDGELQSFVFNDPIDPIHPKSYSNCRMALEQGNLTINYNAFNSNSLKFSVVQTAG